MRGCGSPTAVVSPIAFHAENVNILSDGGELFHDRIAPRPGNAAIAPRRPLRME